MRRRRSNDVTEHDAFGNPIEDARTTSQPLTSGDPLTLGAPTAPRPLPPPAPPRRARRRLLGGLGGLFGLLLFFGPFLAGGWFVYSTIHDAVDDTTGVISTFDSSRTTVTPGTPAGPRTSAPPRGLGARSLLTPTAVDALLRKARADPGGKLLLLRLAPDRADLQLSRPGGGLSILQLRFDGERTLVRTPSGATGSKTIVFSTIDRHAPARLVRAAAHRLGRKVSSIDYVVVINILGKPMWSAYFTGGAAFQGDAHGHITRRIQ
jgi:hypothetical protein